MSHARFKPRVFIRCVLSFLLISLGANSQQGAQQSPESVNIQVQFDQPQGTILPIWNYFGYDEPNYTYAANGQKLLGELVALSSQACLCEGTQSFYHGRWLFFFEVGIDQRLHRGRRGKSGLQLDHTGSDF